MKLKLLIIFLLVFNLSSILSQETIEVCEQTLKIGGLKEEVLYYGFAEGDKIIFNFQEINNKELKELEIIEYPSNTKFSEFKIKKVENKTIHINKTGVYAFRFKNSDVSGRICKVKIERIPISRETINFNTSVIWKNIQDTIWNSYTKDVIIGYDTTYIKKAKIELIQTELREELLLDKNQKVHSSTNSNGNKSSVFFTLPKNEISTLKTKKVISWAYWVGVDEAGNKAWEENSRAISSITKGVASIYLTPLGALALGTVTELAIPKIGEDVSYCVSDKTNEALFKSGSEFKVYDKGKGVAGYMKFTDTRLCQGTYYILLHNDNYIQPINVNIKVVAIIETNLYEKVEYDEIIIKPIIEKKIFKEPQISTKHTPVLIGQ